MKGHNKRKLGRPKSFVNIAVVRQMKKEGIKTSKIAAEFGVSEATIYRLLKSSKEDTDECDMRVA